MRLCPSHSFLLRFLLYLTVRISILFCNSGGTLKLPGSNFQNGKRFQKLVFRENTKGQWSGSVPGSRTAGTEKVGTWGGKLEITELQCPGDHAGPGQWQQLRRRDQQASAQGGASGSRGWWKRFWCLILPTELAVLFGFWALYSLWFHLTLSPLAFFPLSLSVHPHSAFPESPCLLVHGLLVPAHPASPASCLHSSVPADGLPACPHGPSPYRPSLDSHNHGRSLQQRCHSWTEVWHHPPVPNLLIQGMGFFLVHAMEVYGPFNSEYNHYIGISPSFKGF